MFERLRSTLSGGRRRCKSSADSSRTRAFFDILELCESKETEVRDGKAFHLFGGINVHGLETLVRVNRDVGNKSVQLVGGVFVLVSLSVKSDSDSVLDVLDTVFPDGLVQASVDSDV